MSSSSSIRPASADDLTIIEFCAKSAYSHYISRIGREPAPMVADFTSLINQQKCFVLEMDSCVQGFVVFYAKGDHIHLENVAIHPNAQKMGYGLQLIHFVEDQARKQGFDRVELYTNALMTENLEIYPKIGYEQFDRKLEDGFDRIYFRKPV